MIAAIKLSSVLTEPRGLRPFSLRGLPRVVVFAGPNGGGKTRAFRLLQHVIAHAHEALKQKQDNLDSIPIGKEQERQGLIAAGDTDVRAEAYRRQAAQWHEIAQALEPMPKAPIKCIDLSYPIDRPRRLMSDLKPGESQSDIQGTRSKPGFGSAFSALDSFVHEVARDLFSASHPSLSDDPGVKARGAAANAFNDLLEALCGVRIDFGVDDGGQVVPRWGGVTYGYGKLSAGEHTLISWSIVLHRQREALANALIFLDEPELHLHGDACVRAIRALSEHVLGPEGQVWIATHSVPLIAHYGVQGLYSVDKGTVQFAGNRATTLVDRLLGGEASRVDLRHFLAEADALGMYEFFAQCVSAPAIAPAKKDDPQEAQLCEIVGSRSRDFETLRVLDFAAGRGRFAAALARQLSERTCRIVYRAYNDPRFTHEAALRECEANVRQFDEIVGADAAAVTDLSKLLDASGTFDLCIMCNVLHEIPPSEWRGNFDIIGRLLKSDGCLVVMEDLELTVGEHPHDGGFLVLDDNELRALFRADDTVKIAASSMAGRLVAVEVPARWLPGDASRGMLEAFKLTADRARRRMVELRATSAKSFQTGRALAFWATLHFNALAAIDEATALNEASAYG